MTSMNRRAFVQAMLAAGLGAAGIRRHAENTPSTLRIGYQKSSTLITLLKTRGTLEQSLAPLDLRVSWHEFASGLPLTEALNVGAIDFSADVADTVPVFAQAAHARFVYVAQEAPSPKAQAVIVKTGSTLRTLADLRAKRIAEGRRQPLPAACRPRASQARPNQHRDPLPDTGGRPRGVRARQRRCVDHVGSVCRVRRLEPRRADSGRRQRACFVLALLPRIEQLCRRAPRHRPDRLRPSVAGRRVAARASAGSRRYPRADLGTRREDDRARQRATQLPRALRGHAEFR